MKYFLFNKSSVQFPDKVTLLVGVREKKSVVIAKKESETSWIVYKNHDPSCMKKENFRKVGSLPSLDKLLAFFQKRNLTPFCPENQLARAKGEEEKVDPAKMKEKRRYFRKRVNLNGEYQNPRTHRSGDILVEDVSFNGIKFITIGHNEIQVGDLLHLSFVLDNAKKSRITRDVQARHVSENRVGAEIVNSPEYDKELGFYLWVCHG